MSRSSRSLLWVGVAALGAVALFGFLAPRIAPYDPLEQLDAVGGRFRPPLTTLAAVELSSGRWLLADRVERLPEGLRVERRGQVRVLPSGKVANLTDDGVADRRIFLLGSDRFGRDVLSRIIYGARVSLLIAFLSVALSLTIGVSVGAAAALGPRMLDSLLMRLVDGLFAFPALLLLIILAAFYSPNRWSLVVFLGCTSWMGIARLMRSEVLSLRERDFVLAAHGIGASPWRIFGRHILPNAITPIMVQAVLMVGSLILLESTLSFLGFGIPKPYATWGNMIAESRPHLATAWWVGIFPGLALGSMVITLNLATDALRDVLDPRHEPRKAS